MRDIGARRGGAARRLGVLGAATLCVLAAACAGQGRPHHGAVSEGPGSAFGAAMSQSMRRMHLDMAAAPMTGDPDRDFAAMMIPHHLGAVDMAKAVLAHGRDPVLRRLAQEIIVTQQQEIDVMRRRLETAPTPTLTPAPATPAPVTATPSQTGTGRARGPGPGGAATGPTVAVSGRDRVYTADQTSNTVSVIDPSVNRLLGVIRLGDPVPASLNPLYKGQLLVHGMGFSRDLRTLAVVSIASNSVTLIDTATNRVKGVVYIGRSPHEAFFTPDGRQVWATVRGQDYVSVIDPVRMREIRRVPTANGPGMVLFHPDGRYAYVPSSFTPEVDVIDTRTYRVVARLPQASPFSPNLSVSRDGQEVWFTLKDSGRTQVMSGTPPFRILTTLDTGPITNHVTLVDNVNGAFAYVTVGEENVVKVYRRGGATPRLVATIPTGDLPHGVWGSGDGTRVYVGLENQDAVMAIDALANRVIATIPIGQQPQALVYVPEAVPSGPGTSGLVPLGVAGRNGHIVLIAPGGDRRRGHATVSVNSLGPLDLLEMTVSGLKPGETYTLWLANTRNAPHGDRKALADFTANIAGAQIVQAIGLLREPLTPANADRDRRRFLVVTRRGATEPVLLQKTP
ncbi:CopM family metallochaperone [Streptosporangium oxazolinicum]